MCAALWAGFAHYGVAPCWVVLGKVVDASGKPVKGAGVVAHFGVGATSDTVLTDEKGKFLVHVFVPRWNVCKGGAPSINIIATGYRKHWEYYEKWSWGLKFSNLTINLHSSPLETPFAED